MFCLKCGNPIGEGEQFCSQCGTAVQPQNPDESNVLVDSSTDNEKHENGSENISASEASSEPEKAVQPETNDTSESNPRLHQEPIPASAFKSEPPAEPIPAPQIYQAPSQPQYQQQYPQAPNQPNPIPAAASPLPPPPPPFMKRKAYFKSAASEKIKGKVDVLIGLTGMGLGAIVVFLFVFLITLLDGIHANSSAYSHHSALFDIGGDYVDTMFIVSIVALAVLAVFALLCILGMKTKHFAFYIFLLLPSICMTAGSIIGFIMFSDTNSFKFNISDQNGLVAILLVTLIAISAIALILSVISLVLSIIVSGSYKKAKQEYIWRAANENAFLKNNQE